MQQGGDESRCAKVSACSTSRNKITAVAHNVSSSSHIHHNDRRLSMCLHGAAVVPSAALIERTALFIIMPKATMLALYKTPYGRYRAVKYMVTQLHVRHSTFSAFLPVLYNKLSAEFYRRLFQF